MPRIIGGQGLLSTSYSQNRGFIQDFANQSLITFAKNDAFTGFGSPDDNSGVAISNDGVHSLIGVSSTPYLLVANNETGLFETPAGIECHTRPTTVNFSADGTKIVVGYSTAPRLRVYNYPSFTLDYVVTDPSGGGAINVCRFTPDGSAIIVAGDNTPFVWSIDAATGVDNGLVLATPPTADVDVLDVSPDGTMIAYGGQDTGANTKVNRLSDGASLFSSTVDMYACSFSTDSTKLFASVAIGSDQVMVYDTTTWTGTPISYSGTAGTLHSSYATIRSLSALSNDLVMVHAEKGSFLLRSSSGGVEKLLINMSANVGNGALSAESGDFMIQGTVEDPSASPLERLLVVVHEETGQIMGQGYSDVSGDYKIPVYNEDPVTVVVIGQGGETSKLVSGVIPEDYV